jgi:hypothetical protein
MIALGAGDPDAPRIVLELSRHEDAIESRVIEPGWLDDLPGDARDAVRLALAGYHRLAAANDATAPPPVAPAHPPPAPAPAPGTVTLVTRHDRGHVELGERSFSKVREGSERATFLGRHAAAASVPRPPRLCVPAAAAPLECARLMRG